MRAQRAHIIQCRCERLPGGNCFGKWSPRCCCCGAAASVEFRVPRIIASVTDNLFECANAANVLVCEQYYIHSLTQSSRSVCYRTGSTVLAITLGWVRHRQPNRIRFCKCSHMNHCDANNIRCDRWWCLCVDYMLHRMNALPFGRWHDEVYPLSTKIFVHARS